MPSLASNAMGSGVCTVCDQVFTLVPSSGVLRRHGYGGSYPPCPGSGQLPVGGSPSHDSSGVLDDGMCCSPDTSMFPDSVLDTSQEIFSISPIEVNLIKHIPRAARQRAAIVFESCLLDITSVC